MVEKKIDVRTAFQSLVSDIRLFPPPPDDAHPASWYDDVTHTKHGVFAIAGGVLAYLEERQVKTFLSALADHVPGAEIVFTAYSRHEVLLINKSLQHLGMTHAMMNGHSKTRTTWQNGIIASWSSTSSPFSETFPLIRRGVRRPYAEYARLTNKN